MRAVLLAAIVLAGAVVPAEASAAPALEPCRGQTLAGFKCGSVRVPFERADPSLGSLRIGFARRARTERSRPSLGTILAIEGGPGYSSTGSAGEYQALFAGLLRRRDLLLVDMRGTGFSGALRCPGSQRGKRPQRIVAACARKLGPRFASYRTQAAADDLETVRRALGIGPMLVYGDSYGTFLAQSYAFRHPAAIRALVLDSAYPVRGESAWYPSGPRTGMRSLVLACRRSPACGGDPRARLSRALRRLRSAGHSVEPLLNALWAAGYSPPRAYERINDRISELLRLPPRPYGSLAVPSGGRGSAKAYSGAAEMVFSCNDYPMLWKKAAPVADRRRQLRRAVATYPRRRFAPFLPPEVSRSSFLNYRYCLTAPPPSHLYEPPATAGARGTSAPVLVVSGEMDDVTTPTEGRYVARDFRHARQIVVRNAGHVDALYHPGRRAARAIRGFLRRR